MPMQYMSVDLQKDTHSKVKNKGTFQGVIEKIPYLKDLGINQIQCMPVYEFEEAGMRVNYWGYIRDIISHRKVLMPRTVME